MAGIKNKIPNFRATYREGDFNAFMDMIESYLGLYVMTCIPVVVVSFDKGFASVKPVLIRTNSTGEEIEITDKDKVYNIPVMKLSANGWKFNFNVKEGDFGLLICSKYDTSNFKKNHKESVVKSRRMFSVSDGFFLPLDWDEESEEGFVIEKEDTSLILKSDGVTIKGSTVNVEAETANINADKVDVKGDSVDVKGDSVNVVADSVDVDSENVNIGSGTGFGVARIGDEVDLLTGKILTGSSIVKAS